MNAMLGDEELTRLLAEAADSFEVPEVSLPKPEPKARRAPWQSPWLKAAAAVAVVSLGLVGLANLPGGGSTANDTAGQASGALKEPAAGGAVGGTTGGPAAPPAEGFAGAQPPRRTGGRDAQPPAAYGSADQATGATAGRAAGQALSKAADAATRVVKTGEMSLVVDDGKVGATVSRVQGLVTGLRGYVSQSQSDETGEHPSASLVVRVPAAGFEQLVTRIRGLGAKVESQSTNGKDVTSSYADTQAQIQSLKAARERYLAILSRARTIGETLTVQQRVDDVQSQIDRLEGQRRVLANQSDFSTLTVSVSEEGAEKAAYSEPSGWSKAWDDAKDGFTGGVQGLVAHSGRTLLVLLCLAALAWLGRLAYRLVRRQLV